MITERAGTPAVGYATEPDTQDGCYKLKVLAAGLQPTDILRSRGIYKAPELPYIPGGEGVALLADGNRVYFGHAIPSCGALAEWTIVPKEEVWPLPPDIDEGQAIALAIAGTGALIPLRQANIMPGDNVLILGATGPVGQVAAQVARAMGAGRIVAAARSLQPLLRLRERGIVDDIVQLGLGDDEKSLKDSAGEGFTVIFDAVFGAPLRAALRASRYHARIICVNLAGGDDVTLNGGDIARRTLHAVGTGYRPPAERRAAWEYLLLLARKGRMAVDCVWFDLGQISSAWALQRASPAGKIIVRVSQ
ncbi:quinone oxidoreductase family protein [Sphingomonas sp. SRS2]|uniref:quinone oxidoreductase family protein n=1 Tax=Sphingomonas sp. SRS2 TaxID=133190 RepID=UPI001364C843|nr:zinc-binding alcohol dehydrogenase family protein [Sphingomonas sp. SRS2]